MPFSYERAKRELLAEHTKLKEQQEHLKTAQYSVVGGGNHMADDGTEAFDQTVGMALKRETKEALQKVERALAKFENGTYGICESCGGRIDRARLEALPHAVYCMECQNRRELRS